MRRGLCPLLLVGLLPGCLDLGGDEWLPVDAAVPAVTAPATTRDAPPPTVDCPRPGGPATVAVELRINRFFPAQIAICANDTVVWHNADQVSHSVVSGRPGNADRHFSSPLLATGDTWSVTFEVPGEHIYYCAQHKAKMRDARIFVR